MKFKNNEYSVTLQMHFQTIALLLIIALIGQFTQPTGAVDTYLECQSGCSNVFFECTGYYKCTARSNTEKCVNYCYSLQDKCSDRCDKNAENDVFSKRNPSLTSSVIKAMIKNRETGSDATGSDAIGNEVAIKRKLNLSSLLNAAWNKN